MEKWEYLTVKLEKKVEGAGLLKAKTWDAQYFTEQLNTYGQQGWELASLFENVSTVVGGIGGKVEGVSAILKRKVSSQ